MKLDNPIWHALTEDQANFAEGDLLARRFPKAVTTLAGLEETTTRALEALMELVEPGDGVGVVSHQELPRINDKLKIVVTVPLTQMVCQTLGTCKTVEFEPLDATDSEQMQALTALTKPGPFAARTHELGEFIGIKDGGKLIAMAGQRMKFTGHQEVSAVCTHPDYQGRGYARALVREMTQRIMSDKLVPFLHVLTSNHAAIKSYESIGYFVRKTMLFHVLKRV